MAIRSHNQKVRLIRREVRAQDFTDPTTRCIDTIRVGNNSAAFQISCQFCGGRLRC